jgi:hypothetical protein
MLHNGLLNLMIRSKCFGHYYAHHQGLATIQMAPACGTSRWLWQVAGLVHGCRFKRLGRGMLHATQWFIEPYDSLNMFRALLCPSSGACDYTGGPSTSPSLWQVAGLVHGCRFKRPGRGMLHVSRATSQPDQQPAITKVKCHTLGPPV